MTDNKKEVNNFCVTRPRTCTMNYCDENGCQDRKRNLVTDNGGHSFTEGSEVPLTETERIEKQAEDFSFQVPYDGTDLFYNEGKYLGYIAGATAELKRKDKEIANHKAVNSLLLDSDGEAYLANKLFKAQEEIQQLKEALKGFKDVLTTLNTKQIEYNECAVEGNMNLEYFKGKADAYEFAVKQLKRIFEWYGIE